MTKKLQVKLTPAACRDAPIGSVLKDHEVPGLLLRVLPSKRSWYLYHRVAGQQRKPAIGQFPAMSLNAARATAREMLQAVALGADPSRDRVARREAPTVGDLCDAYLEHCARRVAPSTLENYSGYIRTRIRPAWGKRRVSEIGRAEVDRLIWDIERKHGPSEANHVRTQIRAMWNRAQDTFGMVPGDVVNPVRNSHRASEMQRTRLAEPDELVAVFRVLSELQAEQPAHVAAVTCLFLTGMRPGEIENAECRHWRGDRFVIDKHKTSRRTGKEKVHWVHPVVANMIDALPSAGGRPGDLLFGGIVMAGFWRKVRRYAGCPDLQLRDARRTFASYGVSDDASLDRVSQLLGHTNRQTTMRYAHLLTNKHAQLTNEIANRLLGVARGANEQYDDR